MTIEKSYGVRGVADDMTLVRLQELIVLFKEKSPVGKVVIDAEKITYYKFGLKMGITRFATNGIVVNEMGIIRTNGLIIPEIWDREILTDIYKLFGRNCPF